MSEPLHGIPLGRRVVVRHLIEDGARATDALGELVARDAGSVTVCTRAGEVRVALADVVLAKEVPPEGATGWRVARFLLRGEVAVLDLDGVLRTHGTTGAREAATAALGLDEQAWAELVFGLPELRDTLVGRARYADWETAIGRRLTADGHAPELVRAAVDAWVTDHGTPVPETVALVEQLAARGIPAFVLTNGTDRVPEELGSIGLGHLVPHLLNTHELGIAKPDQEAYAAAHAEIERRLGRVVGRGRVHFTDDRPANVDAARVFGWQARVFTLRGPAGRPPTRS